jgi:hypothetical protein
MKILELGIYNKMPEMDKRYVRSTNIINLIYIFVISIPLILFTVFLTEEGIEGYGKFVLLIVFSSANILLNNYRKYLLAKISTLLAPLFWLIIFPVLSVNYIPQGIFLWLPYGIMILGTISFLIFSVEKEKILMLSMIALFVIVIFAFDEFLIRTSFRGNDFSIVKNNYLFYIISKIILTLFLYTTFFIFKFIYFKNQMDLQRLSEELNQKNNELSFLNSSLEVKIEKRTELLKLQNQRIRNLAFTNAHQVRARIARIIGLMEVSKYNITEEEREFYECKIKENVIELDNLTKSISKELIEVV